MNRLRLLWQRLLSTIAIPLHFNHKLTQFCDQCGRTKFISFWAKNEVWEAVAGNVNGQRHGCLCVSCFTDIAEQKGIWIAWKPEISALTKAR